MNFKQLAVISTLAAAAGTAFASAPSLDLSLDNGYSDSVTVSANNKTKSAVSFDQVVDFSLDGSYDLLAVSYNLTSPDGKTNILNPLVTLYTSSGTVVGTPFTISSSGAQETFSDLSAGNYYFEVTGSLAAKTGGSFNITATVTPYVQPLTPSPVPEPATTALLLAGVGVMGFLARRRNQK